MKGTMMSNLKEAYAKLLENAPHNLLGTCKSAYQEAANIEEELLKSYPEVGFNTDTIEDEILEKCSIEEIFRCEGCGWWCAPHDAAEASIDTCKECIGELDDE